MDDMMWYLLGLANGRGGKVNKLDMCDLFEQQTPITTISFSETIPQNCVLCRMAHITIDIDIIRAQVIHQVKTHRHLLVKMFNRKIFVAVFIVELHYCI